MSQLLSAAVATIGLMVLGGWIAGISALTRWHPQWPAMKLNTAVVLVVGALALVLENQGRARRLRHVLALCALLTCALTLLQYWGPMDFGMDNYLRLDTATENNPHPGRMSPLVGVAGLLLTGAILVPVRWARLHDAAALAAFAIGLFSVMGYAYDAQALLRYTQVAFPSALGIVMLSFAVLSSRPSVGWASLVWSSGSAGVVAQRMLPLAVAAPVVAGYARIQITRAGLLPEEQATALMASILALTILAAALFAVQRVRDVDVERNQTLERLRQAVRRADEAELATLRGTWEWDLAADRAEWSKGMYRLFGVDEATFVNSNENFLALVLPEDRTRMRQAMEAALAKPGKFSQDYRIRRADGKVVHVRGEGHVLVDGDGRAVRMHGSVQDVTDRLEVERLRLLHEIDAYQARFVNMAAHEMRTPLLPLRAQVHLLQSSRAEGLTEAQRRSVDLIHRNVERLSSLVEDLLQMARHGSDRMELDLERIDLGAVVADVLRDYAEAAEARHVGLDAVLSGDGTALADPKRVRQVVANLVGNAIKFTPAGGRIDVRVEGRPDEVQVQVRDSGMGIAAEAIGRLFRPFSQVHDTMQVSEAGSGLGLYLSKALVELHGGSVHAHSGGLGMGSTFVVVLPRSGPSEGYRSRGAFAGLQTGA